MHFGTISNSLTQDNESLKYQVIHGVFPQTPCTLPKVYTCAKHYIKIQIHTFSIPLYVNLIVGLI